MFEESAENFLDAWPDFSRKLLSHAKEFSKSPSLTKFLTEVAGLLIFRYLFLQTITGFVHFVFLFI